MPRLSPRDAAARAGREVRGGASGDYSEALARGLRVVAAFNEHRPRMTLAEVSRELALPRATVRRALTTLVHLGYLSLDGRVFALTPRVLGLAAAYLTSNPVSTILQPACERLCGQVGEPCSAAVLDGDSAVMIARAVPNHLIAVGAGIGYRVPALHSALGRMLLSALDENALDVFLEANEPKAITPRTITDKTKLRQLIGEARTQKYSYVDREAESGFQSVAVLVHRWDGRALAALNIGASTDRVDHETMTGPMLDALRQASEELSGQLI